MAKLRKACAYRRLERPYTRRSKYRNQNYIKGNPRSKVVRYDHGNPRKEYPYKVVLVANDNVQVRHNAIESSRLAANRRLEKNLGKGNFHFRIRMFPHHILRENPLASGAGADRMSTGMKKSFGKAIGVAAQVTYGKELLEVNVEKNQINQARKALKAAAHKLPCACSVAVKQKPVTI